jgi:hypothetical protein
LAEWSSFLVHSLKEVPDVCALVKATRRLGKGSLMPREICVRIDDVVVHCVFYMRGTPQSIYYVAGVNYCRNS